MKVKDAYERALLGAGADDSLEDAARRMYAHAVGSLAVFRDSEIVGIITERDILRAASENADLARTSVLDYMTTGVVTVTTEYDVAEAAEMMVLLGARHLPVVDDNGQMLGMLSARDLLSIIDEVPHAKGRDVATVQPVGHVRAGEIILDRGLIEALPWAPLEGEVGVSMKTLWHAPQDHSYAGLMRLEPGAEVHAHTHRYSIHHVFVAQGQCVVHGSQLGPGSYCFVPTGAEHGIVRAGDAGCTLFYLYERASLD